MNRLTDEETSLKVHLIGIGGSGMSAISRLLLQRGTSVSGSDLKASPLLERLEEEGARVSIGHRAEHVAGADLIVRSSAIPDNNPEILEAQRLGIPVLKRAAYLGKLIADRQGIAVAGTHGKTTTSAMIAWILTALNQDPSFIVGGMLTNLNTNARAGDGPAFVIEADEYDHMFLGLHPSLAVITNVEYDHPDFFETEEDFFDAFRQFAANLSKGGSLLICSDDPGAAKLLAELKEAGQSPLAYGLKGAPAYRGSNLRLGTGGGTVFDFTRGDSLFVKVALRVPGRHNVQNAVAALAITDLLGISVTEAAQALHDFRGTARRFQVLGEVGGVTVIDDYAHHPTEIRATLQAARARYPNRTIWAVWQPHTYFRTRTFLERFSAAFDDADQVIVTEIFAAREQIPDDFSASQVAAALEDKPAVFVPKFDQVVHTLSARLKPGDVVLILSAGDADAIGPGLLLSLKERERITLPPAGKLASETFDATRPGES